jgi:hypothetical protein
MDNLADAYVSFSPKKLWHYTKESIQLHHALQSGFSFDMVLPCWLDLIDEALDYLRRTINAVIDAAKSRGDNDFQNFTAIP